jgi:hypothetical protein
MPLTFFDGRKNHEFGTATFELRMRRHILSDNILADRLYVNGFVVQPCFIDSLSLSYS